MQQYRICGKIGEGSFSEVLKAELVRPAAPSCSTPYAHAGKAVEHNLVHKKQRILSGHPAILRERAQIPCEIQFVAVKCMKVHHISCRLLEPLQCLSLGDRVMADGHRKNKLVPNAISEYKSQSLASGVQFNGIATCDKQSANAWGAYGKEVAVLKKITPHSNLLRFFEAFQDRRTRRLCIVTELMEMNLYEYLHTFKGRPMPETLVRSLMWQALRGLTHLHRHGLFHRDIKPENMLISHSDPCVKDAVGVRLKIADLGSCKSLNIPPPYTEYISTRWYRAPECLLTNGFYSSKMDLWGIGCVMFELLTARPLFPGRDEVGQLRCIEKLLGPSPVYQSLQKSVVSELQLRNAYAREGGTVSGKTCSPSVDFKTSTRVVLSRTYPLARTFLGRLLPEETSAAALDLLERLLVYDPLLRPSAPQALRHAFFAPLRAISIPRTVPSSRNISDTYHPNRCGRLRSRTLGETWSGEKLMLQLSIFQKQPNNVPGDKKCQPGATRIEGQRLKTLSPGVQNLESQGRRRNYRRSHVMYTGQRGCGRGTMSVNMPFLTPKRFKGVPKSEPLLVPRSSIIKRKSVSVESADDLSMLHKGCKTPEKHKRELVADYKTGLASWGSSTKSTAASSSMSWAFSLGPTGRSTSSYAAAMAFSEPPTIRSDISAFFKTDNIRSDQRVIPEEERSEIASRSHQRRITKLTPLWFWLKGVTHRYSSATHCEPRGSKEEPHMETNGSNTQKQTSVPSSRRCFLRYFGKLQFLKRGTEGPTNGQSRFVRFCSKLRTLNENKPSRGARVVCLNRLEIV